MMLRNYSANMLSALRGTLAERVCDTMCMFFNMLLIVLGNGDPCRAKVRPFLKIGITS